MGKEGIAVGTGPAAVALHEGVAYDRRFNVVDQCLHLFAAPFKQQLGAAAVPQRVDASVILAHYRCAAPAHHVVTRERWGSSPLDNDPRMHCDGATPAVGAR